MTFLKHRNITRIGLLIVLFFVLKPVLDARILDDDPVALGSSGQDQYVRWSSGILDRWPRAPFPITLKYGFEQNMSPIDLESVEINYLSEKDIKNAFARAFATWSSVIEVTFEEVDGLSKPDIRIGFFYFDRWMINHLIHPGAPPLGGIRLNAGMSWAVEFNNENSKDAYDLESVAIHAIGDVLGLGHSHSKEAIMYKQMYPGIKKVDLTFEDVAQAQRLYGPNPEYHRGSSPQCQPEPFPEYHQLESSPAPSLLESSPAPSQLSLGGSNILKELSTRSLGFGIHLLLARLIIILTNL